MRILGIDFGGTTVKTGLVEGDHLHAKRKVPVNPNQTFQQQLDALVPTLKELQEHDSSDNIGGIGLSFPGIVNRSTSSVRSTNQKHSGATDVDLDTWAEQSFQLPLILENDARCALLGERYAGAGTNTSNLLMVTLGTGFGSSVLIKDHVLTGTHQQAGVLGGHLTIRKDGYECTCGNRGCVETETGEWNLPRIIRNHPSFSNSALSSKDELTYRTLIEAAEHGDEVARELLQERIEYMARGIVNLIHAYDPERVVVGGGVMNRPDVVLPELENEIHKFAWTPWGSLNIHAADYPDYAALFGLHALFHHDIQTI